MMPVVQHQSFLASTSRAWLSSDKLDTKRSRAEFGRRGRHDPYATQPTTEDGIEALWGEGDEGSVNGTGNEGATRETRYAVREDGNNEILRRLLAFQKESPVANSWRPIFCRPSCPQDSSIDT
jgi:hypothetical protein